MDGTSPLFFSALVRVSRRRSSVLRLSPARWLRVRRFDAFPLLLLLLLLPCFFSLSFSLSLRSVPSAAKKNCCCCCCCYSTLYSVRRSTHTVHTDECGQKTEEEEKTKKKKKKRKKKHHHHQKKGEEEL